MSDSGGRILALVLGFWVLMRLVNWDATGRTLADYILGRHGSVSPLLNLTTSIGGQPVTVSVSTGEVNPVPGATGGRLDQGMDVTGKDFLAPFSGRVVAASQSDPGWGGGGYLAIQNALDPSQVVYMAEGIVPFVSTGQIVTAGERVGYAHDNPYNGILGNIEIGPANPKNPYQPLAQVASNKAGVVQQFYNWLQSLGGPQATSTSLAGYP